MLMLKSTHEAIVAKKDAEIGDLLERLGSADQKVAHAANQLWLSNKTHREAHEAMTLLTCQLAEARSQLAVFTAPRKRGLGGRFVSSKGGVA